MITINKYYIVKELFDGSIERKSFDSIYSRHFSFPLKDKVVKKYLAKRQGQFIKWEKTYNGVYRFGYDFIVELEPRDIKKISKIHDKAERKRIKHIEKLFRKAEKK